MLIAILMILSMVLLSLGNISATTENTNATDSNLTPEMTEDTNNITSTTNSTEITGNTTSTTNSTNGTSLNNTDNSNEITDQAAGGDSYTNVRGVWLSTSDVNTVNVTALMNANITDIFVKANLISSPTYQSVLTTVIQKFAGTGIRIHAWITCFMGTDGWINPENTTQRTFLLNKITDIVTYYNVEGIHLDYVRYPGTAYNYSNSTETITSFVREAYNTVKGIKAKVAVSAALMPEGSVNAYYYGQDYASLAPYLDFLVPMIYKGNYRKDTVWIGSTTQWISEHSGGKPVVAGLQTYESDYDLTPLPVDELKGDITVAANNGSSGFVLFRYGLIDNAFFVSQSTINFTIEQIRDAAATVKNYIEAQQKLPDTITINGTTINMAQFLELLMTATLQLDNGNTNPIPLRTYNAPTNPVDDITAGNILKTEYLKIAGDLKSYMDTTGRTPDYQYQTSLGVHLGFENLIYMYSKVLDYHKTNGVLPNYIVMESWRFVSSPTLANFTITQIKDAAVTVNTYVDMYYKLPDNVIINGINVNMSQFLELLMTATLQLDNGNTDLIALKNYSAPTNPIDDIKTGNIIKTEYLKIANDLKTYMHNTGKTPDYQYQTSLGIHLGFQNLIYMYSKVLDYHKTNGKLPDYSAMQPWSTISGQSAGIIPNGPKFTIDQIKDAATTVNTYIDTYYKLPDTVTINGTNINMSQFLELLMTATLQLNSGNTNPIPLRTYNAPAGPIDDITAGNILKTEYLKIAGDLKTYMDTTGRTPDYQYQTSLGIHLGFQNLIYMYSMVLNSYNSTNNLPNYIVMESWRFVSSPTLANFTIDQIKDAAEEVKMYIETNSNLPTLPDNVTINGIAVSMSQFLELLMAATLQLNSGNTNPIPLKAYSNPADPVDSIKTGNVFQWEYLKIANDLKNYMHITGKTPDYQYKMSLGYYLGFENLIYMYSKILNYHKTNGNLPNYVEMQAWGIHGYWMRYDTSFNAATLKSSGITDIFFLTRNVNGDLFLDGLKNAINSCKSVGIRVHAWIVCFKDDNVFVNPITAGYKETLLTQINSIAAITDLSGIHLDYVRYSGVASKGQAAWQAPGGTESAVGVITEFIRDVYNSVKIINSKIVVSAAVMPEGDKNRDLYGQDYSRIADYVDFLLPMTYEGNYNANNVWITSATRYIVDRAKGKPVYAGLTTYWSDTNTRSLSPIELQEDVNSALYGGASGYVLFRCGFGCTYVPS